MSRFALFTDVSLDPRLKLGVGAFLIVPEACLEAPPEHIERTMVTNRLMVKRFENVSSTRLEVMTVVWALDEYNKDAKKSGLGNLSIYTDSQCVAGLMGRRPGLEAHDFRSKKTKRLLHNGLLYRDFYKLYDELRFEVIQVAGHSRFCSHDTIQRIFSYVDRQVRKELHSGKQ